MRILVLSDVPRKANFLASVLQYIGHAALPVNSLDDAVLHARYFDFDLAVLVLPLTDCHTIGRRLERWVGCSVLALNNREVAEDEGHSWLPSSRSVLNKIGDKLLEHGLRKLSQI